ncbi:MAG: F0F1 ATP synthase subunit A [bacterium]
MRIMESTWTTWGIILVFAFLALLVRSRLRPWKISRLQAALELYIGYLQDQIREMVGRDPRPYVPLIGTLALYVFTANLLGMVPGLSSPTSQLPVPAGLAAVVFFAVPWYGIREQGIRDYLKQYAQPSPFLLPFNIISELSRTLALAVRLFGNIMSGEFLLIVIIGVVTSLLRGYASVFLPGGFLLTLFLSVISIIVSVIQAYIFVILALVYIGAGVERRVARVQATQDEE